jgi:hypothetical protein
VKEYNVLYDHVLGVKIVERECHGCGQTNGGHKNHCKAPSSPDANSSGACNNGYVTHLPSNYRESAIVRRYAIGFVDSFVDSFTRWM